jgi:hypothetical protein
MVMVRMDISFPFDKSGHDASDMRAIKYKSILKHYLMFFLWLECGGRPALSPGRGYQLFPFADNPWVFIKIYIYFNGLECIYAAT